MKKYLLMSVLGMLAIDGVQAQSGNGGSALLKTLPMEQAGVVSNLRAADATYWDLAKAAEEYAGGTGTEADPYLIETPEQLMKLCVDATATPPASGNVYDPILQGVYYKQIADIDLSEAYSNSICIGTYAFFAGNYDGNGHKIIGYKVLVEEGAFGDNTVYLQGLFLNQAIGTLKNIVMEDAEMVVNDPQIVNNTLDYSFLVANASMSKIENCQVSGTIDFTVGGQNTAVLVAGIVANSTDTEINNCSASGSINVKFNVDGEIMSTLSTVTSAGIVASIWGDSKISNCINNMDVTSEMNGTSNNGMVSRTAGIAASAQTLNLLNSANAGDVQVSVSNAVPDVTSWVSAAGLVGYANEINVNNCWNASQVTSVGGTSGHDEDSPLVCSVNADETYINCSFDNLLFTESCDEGVAMETSAMQSPNFVETLNANLPEGALEWEYVEGAYPVLGEAQEEPETPTANESVTKSETVLRVLPGAVVVTSPEAVEFAAYTFSGAMQTNELLPAGTSTVNLPAGLYILKVGDETYKVNVK